MRDEIIRQVEREKVIAIVRGVSANRIPKLVQALYDGGIRMVEVTFDQSSAEKQAETLDGIRKIAMQFSGRISVGAGTVTSVELVDLAAEAGAKYIISPDTNEAVIKRTRELGLVSMPGALTPTEVMQAYRWGADFVKIFPVGNLGPGYVKAIKAPLNHVKLLAVGGVNADNVKDFLTAGCCGAGVGGNLVNKTWIEAGEYEKLTEAAKELMRAVGNC